MSDWQDWNISKDGRGMISASAGTGKTFTIAVLFVRLILERGLLPDQIVVTTFTNAAVAELSERLRARIHGALVAARAEKLPEDDGKDPLLSWLIGRWQDEAMRAKDRKQLLAAWSAMDRAPILTLHGFCSKLIGEYPLLVGAPLEPTPLMGEPTVVEEIADDIWRRHTQNGSAGAFLDAFATRGRLKDRLAVVLKPELQLAEVEEGELADYLKSATGKKAVKQLRDIVENKLTWFASNRKVRTGSPALLDWLTALQNGQWNAVTFDPADFAADKWPGAVLKAHREDAEKSLNFDLFDELAEQITAQREAEVALVDHEAREQYATYMETRNVTTFSQMIYRVFEVLHRNDANARELADSVFARYPVVMIDESQDTDQVQYAIMDEIYRDADSNIRGRMIMIGDVKQAIYGFRGGDVESFQMAEELSDDKLTLSTNYRSSPEMLDGFNSFYELLGEEMSVKAEGRKPIQYERFQKPGNSEPGIYRIDGERVASALQLHVGNALDFDPKARADKVNDAVLQTCANQVAMMLQSGTHTIQPDKKSERPLEPGDFAVILRNNADVAALRRLLTARGVPAVTQLKNSVLMSPWLLDLASVVAAAAEPFNEGKVAAAGVTRFFDGESAIDPHAWAIHLNHSGILGLALALLRIHGPRLMARVDGERAMTDIRHLAEIMQEHFAQTGDARETLQWIYQERDAGEDDPEAPNSLRMESDAKRVQVMTAHASKGLEYNIVMLPTLFGWGPSGGKGKLRTVKADDRIHVRLAVDGNDTAALDAAESEENHRLQYVALTRAKYACHIYYLENSKKKGSPMIERWQDIKLPRKSPGLLITQGLPQPHDEIVKWSGSSAKPAELRTDALQLPLARMPRYQHSFSTMTRTHHEQAARGGEDESDVEVAEDTTTKNATILKLNKVKGKHFGVALHEALEALLCGDLTKTPEEVVESEFQKNGVKHDDEIVKATVEMVERTLNTPINLGAGKPLKLGELQSHQIQRELNFRFELENRSVKELQKIVAKHGESDLFRGVTARELSGLLKGSIDLLFEHEGKFYVVDYKGNYLGDSVSDYEEPSLTERVEQQNYDLQAFVYSLAVDRMLRARTNEAIATQHGGAAYLYTRALGLSDTAGVWRRHFDPALLKDVNELLAVKGENQ